MQTPLPGRPPPQLANGRFLIIDTLGDGGTATVYLCWDARDRQWCALKAVQRAILADTEMVRRFRQEAEALSRFTHPNIPRLVFHDCDATPPYMVMELARSGAVMDWVKENGPMPATLAVDVLFQVCQALQEAHEQGIVHRDVKPHNFLIDDDGVCKLTDFGIARWGDAHSMTVTGSQIGTFSFMAPEQRSDTKSVDHRADIYSLGASLYTMVTARTSAELFVADSDDAILADVPGPFRSVILKATQYRPDERYDSAREFQDALMEALGSISPARVVDVPPLTRDLAPLPRRPPEMLPADTVFPEIDGLLGGDVPSPPPVQRQAQRPSEETTERTVVSLGYTMPTRPQTRFSRDRMDAGYMVSDDGATYLTDPDDLKTELTKQVRREVEKALRHPDDEGLVGFGPVVSSLMGLTGLVVAVVFICVGVGCGMVVWYQMGHDQAGRSLRAAVHANASVVYDLARDRTLVQTAFNQYETAEGYDQLQAAAEFVDAVENAANYSERLEQSTLKRLNRLRSARDEYRDALQDWEVTTRQFPGSVSVRLALVSAPPPSGLPAP